MSKKPTVLMILDGYGLRDTKEGNAVALAKTPVMDKLMKEYPFVRGNARQLRAGESSPLGWARCNKKLQGEFNVIP